MADAAPELRATVRIQNRLGLHMRAARKLVETVEDFEAEVTISKDGHAVNARSLLGVMTLAAERGSEIEIATRGPQAAEALAAIRALVEAGFHLVEPEA